MESFSLLGRGRLLVTKVFSPGSESKILSAYCVWDSFLPMGDVKFCLMYIFFYFVALCEMCLVMRLAYLVSRF